jgi:UDP-N-acetylglucosamine 2-epimerase (non-hydrolysing)
MINILCVIGTRPEAIKMAPVIKELGDHKDFVRLQICVTAQHREMMDQVLKLFSITPDFDLNIMSPGQSLSSIAANVLTGLAPILDAGRYDWVLVQGDTTTVAAASLAAFYAGIAVGHVEAGLRTFDRRQPFPEEINRSLLGVLADRHYAPTESARQNLLRSGDPAERIVVTGNTVIDALNMVLAYPYDFAHSRLAKLLVADKKIVLVTVHRRESFGQPLREICAAIKELAARYQDQLHFIWPVHPNPNVRPVVEQTLGRIANVSLIEPLSYIDVSQLMKRSFLILTDSGGIQEEAPTLHVPVLVLREVTERQEALDAGTARLVGAHKEVIIREVGTLIQDAAQYQAMTQVDNPFGDGKAAERIVADLLAPAK